MPIRLAISGEDRPIVDRLTRICSQERDVAVVARYTTSRQTLQKLPQHRPDILVLDMRSGNSDALNVLRHSRGRPARCIILIDSEDDSALEALRLGVCGVVPADMAAKLLMRCVRDVHAGSKWLERHFAIRILDKLLETHIACGR